MSIFMLSMRPCVGVNHCCPTNNYACGTRRTKNLLKFGSTAIASGITMSKDSVRATCHGATVKTSSHSTKHGRAHLLQQRVDDPPKHDHIHKRNKEDVHARDHSVGELGCRCHRICVALEELREERKVIRQLARVGGKQMLQRCYRPKLLHVRPRPSGGGRVVAHDVMHCPARAMHIACDPRLHLSANGFTNK